MKKFFNYLILSLIICLSMSAMSVKKTKSWGSPTINGNHCFTFSTTVTSGGGQIVATPGTYVTVTVSASTSSSTYLRIIAFRFTDGTDYISANNGSGASKSFLMPAGGAVNWGGSFSTSNNGSGSACVQ